jgi:hypothetical protein
MNLPRIYHELFLLPGPALVSMSHSARLRDLKIRGVTALHRYSSLREYTHKKSGPRGSLFFV